MPLRRHEIYISFTGKPQDGIHGVLQNISISFFSNESSDLLNYVTFYNSALVLFFMVVNFSVHRRTFILDFSNFKKTTIKIRIRIRYNSKILDNF